MKDSRLLLGYSLAIAFAVCVLAVLAQTTGPLLADSATAVQSFQDRNVAASATDAKFMPNSQAPGLSRLPATPLIKVAACLPNGAACDKASDCCSNNCTPQHHKCGR